MTILYLLIPIALLLGGAALAGFIWAARSGQFEDLETPAYRSLLDDDFTSPAKPKCLKGR